MLPKKKVVTLNSFGRKAAPLNICYVDHRPAVRVYSSQTERIARWYSTDSLFHQKEKASHELFVFRCSDHDPAPFSWSPTRPASAHRRSRHSLYAGGPSYGADFEVTAGGSITVTFSTERGEQDKYTATGQDDTSPSNYNYVGFTAVVKIRIKYYRADGVEIDMDGNPIAASDPRREYEVNQFGHSGMGSIKKTVGPTAFDGYYFVWYDNTPANAVTAIRSYRMYVSATCYPSNTDEFKDDSSTRLTDFRTDPMPWP